MNDILPVPEGTEEAGVEKLQDPVRLESSVSTNADEVATVQEAGLVREERLNEEADGA